MFEDTGRYKLVQLRYRLDNNRKEFRVACMGFVNDHKQRQALYDNTLAIGNAKAIGADTK